ncbi:MAG: glycosyltransferase [Ramlibacter sp.]|nr:glycosyltransferase [Cryobacterium sp.]
MTQADPLPSRVIAIDLDAPLPDLADDPRYRNALVIGWRGGRPLGSVNVDLRGGNDAVQRQIAPLYALHDDPVFGPGAADVALPAISVVVPSMVARPADLELLLDGFARADYPVVEFILVDNRGTLPKTDPLPAILATRPWLRVVREPRPGVAAARNAGVSAARHGIIAFTDDDVRVDPQWLTVIGRRFALDAHVDMVSGLILPAELETPAQIWFERYYGGFSGERSFAPLTIGAEATALRALRGSRVTVRDAGGGRVRDFAIYGIGAYAAGANMAFRRTALERAGGFDVGLGTGTVTRGGEDLATTICVLWTGGTLAYEPASVVHHRHRREVPELVRQLQGNGLGFTAMLASLVVHDSRHLVSLGAQLPRAAWEIVSQSVRRLATAKSRGPASPDDDAATYPRSLAMNELRHYPGGPLAYARSSRLARDWER